MSETVKLIIEIPKKDIELIRKTSFVEDERTMFKQSPSDRQGTMMLHRLMDSVKNGIPLDDVKAEIREKSFNHYFEYGEYVGEDCRKERIIHSDQVLEILDNIGKGDSE